MRKVLTLVDVVAVDLLEVSFAQAGRDDLLIFAVMFWFALKAC